MGAARVEPPTGHRLMTVRHMWIWISCSMRHPSCPARLRLRHKWKNYRYTFSFYVRISVA